MTLNLRTNLAGLFVLFAALPIFATNIAIIESQSFHPMQTMDIAWEAVATGMGHEVTILPQSTLDNLSNLADYDVLIVSSGLITTLEIHKATIEAYVQSGRNAYIQSEFAINHSGNITFAQIVNNNGGSFQWLGAVSGSIAPVSISAPFNEGSGTVDALFYFWYGTYGTGDATVVPFIEGQDKYWGFVFNSPNSDHGLTITTADQDWIRVRHSDILMENILLQLTFEPVIVEPTVMIEQTLTPSCVGEDYEFIATITDSIPEISLQWQINGHPVNGANQAIFTITDLQDSDVVECLLGLNNNNQHYLHLSNPILVAPVFPLAEVTVQITASELVTCANETIVLTATGENWGDQPQFSWNVNGVEVATQNNPIFTTTANGNQNITCTVNSNATCITAALASSNTITIDTIVTIFPTVSITANNTQACANETITLTATGENWGDQTAFSWSINGIEVDNQNDAIFTTTANVNQHITCIVNTNTFCNNSVLASSNIVSIDTITTTVPTVSIEASNTQICAGTEVSFSAMGSDWNSTTSVEWFLNGVSVANTTSYATDLLENGQTVTAVLTQTDECGNLLTSSANPIAVTVIDQVTPTVTVFANLSQACPGEAITYTATGDHWGDAPQFKWIVNGSTIITTASVEFVYGQSATSNRISCELISDKSCIAENNILSNEISVSALSTETATLAIEADNPFVCNGSVVNFRALGDQWGESPSFEWSVDGTVVNTSAAFYSAANLQTGSEVTCRLTTNKPCVGLATLSSNKITIQASNFQLALVEKANATCGNNNGLVEFAIEGGLAPYRIQWSNGLTETFNAELAPGVYEIFVIDASGCTAELEVAVEGIMTPQIENLQIQDATCIGSFGEATIEMADPTLGYTYRWVNEQNFILSDSTRLVNAKAGDYTLLVTDLNGCSTERTITIVETVEIQAEIITDTIITLGEEATLSLDIFANSPISIAWKDSTVLSCNDCFETSTIPTESTIYTAVLTSQEGCQLEVSQAIKVNKTKELHIPNAFSPNGDGVNDYFTVFGGTSYVRNIKSLQIFNRWGAKVFSKTNMDINDEAQGWSGKVGSTSSDMGVYIYVAEIEFIDGETKVMTGDVSLMK